MNQVSFPSSPDSNSVARTRKTRAARLSVASNAAFVLIKLVVGIASGSVGVLSEALHSATDLVASGIAYLSVRSADAPPDEDHPYGHGKIESVSGLAESLLIFIAAAAILYESVRKLTSGAEGTTPPVTAGLVVMGLSAGVNVALSRHLKRVAQETDSLALAADAEHLQTDVVTSVGVFIGLALTQITRRPWLDPLAALIVALLILRTAYSLARDAMHPLLDARLPAEEEAAIQEILETEPQVLGYHKLRTRKSGSQRHADIHVLIDDDSTLVAAHDLTEDLEDRIRAILPAIHVNIHIEPYHAEMRHQREQHGAASGEEITDAQALWTRKTQDETPHRSGASGGSMMSRSMPATNAAENRQEAQRGSMEANNGAQNRQV